MQLFLLSHFFAYKESIPLNEDRIDPCFCYNGLIQYHLFRSIVGSILAWLRGPQADTLEWEKSLRSGSRLARILQLLLVSEVWPGLLLGRFRPL